MILAIVAVAIFGTVLLTREDAPEVSQEDKVRSTIQNFDTAIQKGDLATLRSITCGDTADSYIKYDEKSGATSTPASRPPVSTRWWRASTRSSSTATTPRPT